MAHNPEAMSDLQRIVRERKQLYRQADASINTSERSVDQVVAECLQHLQNAENHRAGILV
jgi:shikimate kinase